MGSNKGRTVWEILSGKNKRDLTPLELQYHNPLKAKIGNTISVEHWPEFANVNFVIEKISVYETKIKAKKFYHTDYHLKGISLDMEKPVRLRLRLIPDEDATNKLACKLQLLHLYDQCEWDEGLYSALNHSSGEFHVNYDDEGVELQEPRKYWRVADVLDPYHARITILKDVDGDGKVEENELERENLTYWDYHRDTVDENKQPFRESLYSEMNDQTRYFTMFRGREVLSEHIFVI